MKIKSIEATAMEIPLKKPYHLSDFNGIQRTTTPIIVKITTEGGIEGYGECDPQPLFTGESAGSVLSMIETYYAPNLIGKDPSDLPEINRIMDALVNGMPLSKAPIDIACYDIWGKALDIPAYSLLGGAMRKEIEIMGAVGRDTVENNLIDIEEMIHKGYSSVMVKVGSKTVEEDIGRVCSINQALKGKFRLIPDANQGWTVGEALAFARGVKDCNIAYFEQPVASWDVEGLKRIKNETSLSVSADESLFSIPDARRLIESGAVDAFSIKVNKHGGITKAKKIMEMAEGFGLPCLMNSMLEEGIAQAASLQLGMSGGLLVGSGHAYFSPLRLAEDITSFSEQIDGGTVKISGRPGLGIEVYEDVLRKYEISRILIS